MPSKETVADEFRRNRACKSSDHINHGHFDNDLSIWRKLLYLRRSTLIHYPVKTKFLQPVVNSFIILCWFGYISIEASLMLNQAPI